MNSDFDLLPHCCTSGKARLVKIFTGKDTRCVILGHLICYAMVSEVFYRRFFERGKDDSYSVCGLSFLGLRNL